MKGEKQKAVGKPRRHGLQWPPSCHQVLSFVIYFYINTSFYICTRLLFAQMYSTQTTIETKWLFNFGWTRTQVLMSIVFSIASVSLFVTALITTLTDPTDYTFQQKQGE